MDKIKTVICVLHRDEDVEECNALKGNPKGASKLHGYISC